MGLFRRGPDTTDLANVMDLLGLGPSLPVPELRQARKDWVREWKSSRVSAAHFLVDRYGMQVTDGGEVVPTRGVATNRPLAWNPRSGYNHDRARQFILDVHSGKVPRTDP